MKTPTIIGILLIILGVIALAYQGINYSTRNRERVVELGPLKVDATVEREHTIPLPPILGVCALAGGVILLVTSARKQA